MANWRKTVELCSDEKILWENHYYRFRKLDDTHYELARLVAGPCGDFTYHPKITVTVQNELFVPISYFDNEETPIKQLTRDDDESFLDQAFVNLLDSFLQAKQTQE